jgi:hypothetical protein
MRSLLRFLVFIALVGGSGLIALKMYLHSSAVTTQIASRLQATLGVPVTVGALELGGTDSAATNITIYEADAPTGSAPLVTIGRATSDIGVADLISGSTEPKKITISDVHLTLRYDRDGHLLTKLPTGHAPSKAIPEFRLERGSVTITKIGEPDSTFHGMDALLIEKDGRVALTGQVTDAAWGGVWTAAGSLPRQPGMGTLELKNAGLHITQEMLRRVPFVSDNVWKHVTLEGDTPVQLLLTLPPLPATVGYRLLLAPRNTMVNVPAIDLTATAAQGTVVIDNNVVMLREVRGKVAEGDLHVTSADLDFRNPATVMRFDLDGRRLNIHSLPPSWKLPPRLGGKLSGMANLIVKVIDGHAWPTGTGDGRVDEAMLGFIPIPNYGLRIKADHDGFSFEPRLGQ